MREFIKIAFRNLGRNLRRTIIITCAIAIGVWGAVVTIAIYNAFSYQMVENFIDANLGHIQILKKGYHKNPRLRLCILNACEILNQLKAIPHLAGYAPRINAFALTQSPRASQGVLLCGIDPELEPSVTRIKEFVIKGEYFSASDENAVLVGKRLAQKLKVEVGDKLTFFTQGFQSDEEVVENFRIKGIYQTGITEIDKAIVYLPLPQAERILGMEDKLNEIALRVDEEKNLKALKAELVKRLESEKLELEVAEINFGKANQAGAGLRFYKSGLGQLIVSPQSLSESFKLNPEVAAISPRLALPMAMIYQDKAKIEHYLDLKVYGVEPINENRISGIFDRVKLASDSWLKDSELDKELEVNQDWVILNKSAISALGAEIGDTVRLDSGDKILTLEVLGILEEDWESAPNEAFALVSWERLWRTFISQSSASEIVVRLKPGAELETVKKELLTGLGIEVQDWRELWPILAEMTQLMNYTNLVLLLCIYIVIAFGIANTMVMSVFERVREFGILKAIGTKPSQLFGMVILESVMLALLGMALGGILSGINIWFWARNGLDLSMFAEGLEAFGMPTVIYPFLRGTNIISAVLLALGMAVLSAFYPGLRASRIMVASALRKI